MRYLLAVVLMLTLTAQAHAYNTNWYVNAGHPNARNVFTDTKITSQGMSADSPFITPSYAITQMTVSNATSPDTMYIYAYTLAVSDSAHYQDNLLIRGDVPTIQYINFVGVSSATDSTIFRQTTLSGGNGSIKYIGHSNGKFTVDGFRIRNTGDYGVTLQSMTTGCTLNVRNCIFDSPAVGIPNYVYDAMVHIDMGPNIPCWLNVYNSTFYFSKIQAIGLASQTNTKAYISIDQSSFNNDSFVIGYIHDNFFTGDTANVTITNSLLNTDFIVGLYEATAGNRNIMDITISNCDTYGVRKNFDTTSMQTASVAGTRDTVNFTFSNMYSENPDYKYVTPTDSRSAYCYLNNPPASIVTGSTTGGLVGVLWGYASPATSTTTLIYRQPFAMRYRQLLWRR